MKGARAGAGRPRSFWGLGSSPCSQGGSLELRREPEHPRTAPCLRPGHVGPPALSALQAPPTSWAHSLRPQTPGEVDRVTPMSNRRGSPGQKGAELLCWDGPSGSQGPRPPPPRLTVLRGLGGLGSGLLTISGEAQAPSMTRPAIRQAGILDRQTDRQAVSRRLDFAVCFGRGSADFHSRRVYGPPRHPSLLIAAVLPEAGWTLGPG